jgi:hypothetical protein
VKPRSPVAHYWSRSITTRVVRGSRVRDQSAPLKMTGRTNPKLGIPILDPFFQSRIRHCINFSNPGIPPGIIRYDHYATTISELTHAGSLRLTHDPCDPWGARAIPTGAIPTSDIFRFPTIRRVLLHAVSLHLHTNTEEPPRKKESFIHDFEVRKCNRGSEGFDWVELGAALEMQVQEGAASRAKGI